MNISVRTAWKSNRKASERVNAHRHEYNELVFYHSGEGETWIGAPYAFSPGDLAIIPAGRCTVSFTCKTARLSASDSCAMKL